jgi:hypothetical protein
LASDEASLYHCQLPFPAVGERQRSLAYPLHHKLVLGDLLHSVEGESQLPINGPARFVAVTGDRKMAALARTRARAFGTDVGVEALKIIAIFCGAGLLVSLAFASYGLDLSPGFF